MVTITLNGEILEVSEEKTLLQIARENGIDIPTLCNDEKLEPYSACRLCVVEIEGMSELPTSCSTYPEEGMSIRTDSEKVLRARTVVLHLIHSNHPPTCKGCLKVGECDLQSHCSKHGIFKTPDYRGVRKEYPIDDNNPAYIRDYSKCILCGKCVAVCRDVQVTGTIDFTGKGFETKVDTAFHKDVNLNNCRFCGQCISVCPTGALMNKQLMGKRPWKAEKVRTTCPFCGVGCNYDLNVIDGKIIGVTPTDEAIVNGTSICVKGRFHSDMVASKDRITKPLIRKSGELVESTWEEAYEYIVTNLTHIKEIYGSDAITGLSSARCTNEDNYIFQKFFRTVLGTNNIDHCARTCHAPTVAGLATTLGSGAMTNSIGEIEGNDLFFVIGCNATEAHPIIGNKIKKAVKQGKKLIVIDPRRTELARMADYWLPLNSGTDAALINGLMHIIIKEDLHDKEFIKNRCQGFDVIKELVATYTPEVVREITGISEDMLYQVARIYATTGKAGIFYTLGITEHTTGTANVMNLANLAMVTGHLGKPNTGINPLRGQNNVQGSCDMGALPNYYPGYQMVTDPVKQEKFERAWGVKLSAKLGLRIPEMLEEAVAGTVKAMYIMGEDPVLTDADANHVKLAMRSLDLLIVQNMYLTETAKLAHVVLPSACYAEKDGTFTNTERRVQRVRKAVELPGDCQDDWVYLATFAKGMGGKGFDYEKAEDIFDEMTTLVPQFAGINYDRIEKDGIQWPCTTCNHPGTKYLHEGEFTHGQGIMVPVEYEPPAELTNNDYPILLNTGRMLYHYNISTRISETLDALRPEELAEIHPKDARVYGLDEKSTIRVSSRRGSILTRIRITDKVQPGTMFMTFHYRESPVNELTNSAFDPITKTAEFKVTAVKIEKEATATI